MVIPPVLPLHLGALHPAETALTLALAFGPFVVLGIVIAVRRRQDRVEADRVEAERERDQRER